MKGQRPTDGTNVDTNYLKPKWMGANLTNLTFRNGDKIKIAKDLNEWKILNSTGKAPESAVYIKKTELGDEYFYNYYAITDPRNIIPEGYRLPNKSDFTTDIDFSLSNRGKIFENSTQLHIAPSGSIEWNEVDKKFSFFSHDKNYIYIWTSDPSSTTDYWGTQNIKITPNGVEIRTSQSLRTCGYVVRCIEDNDNEIKNKLHEYKSLLPEDFNLLNRKIEDLVFNNCKIKFGEKLTVNLVVSFDQNGRNTSSILSFSPLNKTSELIKLIDSIIKSETVAPIYKGTHIKAKTEFSIEYLRIRPAKEKSQTALNFEKKSESQTSHFKRSTKLKMACFLRDKPNATGNVLCLIAAGEDVEVLYQSKDLSGYVYIMYKGTLGYINDIYLNNSNNQVLSNIQKADITEPQKQHNNKQTFSINDRRFAKGRKISNRDTKKHQMQLTMLYNKKIRQDKRNERKADYIINNRTVIKHYLGVSLGTTHPILQFANSKQFSGNNHSGFAQTGFALSLDSYIRIKNGIGIKIKADVMSFNFNSSRYESVNMSPKFNILNKKNSLITSHYYLIQNLMTGFSFNIGKYKLLFEFSVIGGITTGLSPVFKYSNYPLYTSLNSKQNFFIGVGYQVSGAFRIRCTSTFAIKIGATYTQSLIPHYTNPAPNRDEKYNTGNLIITAISPQISLVGMFYKPK